MTKAMTMRQTGGKGNTQTQGNVEPRYDPARTTAVGMTRYAVEFLATALLADKAYANDAIGSIAPVSIMYLVGHSIELSLKAYLLHRGYSLGKVMNLRHDLKKALRKARKEELDSILSVTELDHEVLITLNKTYKVKELEYIVTGAKRFPAFGPLVEFADALVVATCLHIPLADGFLTRPPGIYIGQTVRASLLRGNSATSQSGLTSSEGKQ